MLGPGVPDPPAVASVVPKLKSRHLLPAGTIAHARSVLGGVHHEYAIAAGQRLIIMSIKVHYMPPIFTHHRGTNVLVYSDKTC